VATDRRAAPLDAGARARPNARMRSRLLLVAAAAALIAAGCSHARKPPPPAPLPVERPLVALETARVESLGFTGLHLEFGCRIENGNPFPLSVLRVSWRLALEGRTAATGAVEAPLAVGPAVTRAPGAVGPAAPAPGLAAFTLPVSVRYQDVPAFAPLLQLGREAAWALTGEVVFSTPAGPIAVPLRQEGRLALPRAPRFRVERAVLRKATPKEIVVEVAVAVHNPNPFPLPAGRIGYGLFLSVKEVARADAVIGEPIGPGEEAVVAVPLRVSVLKAGTAAARLLLPFTSLDVAVRGEAVFDGVPVPLDLSSSLVPGL
jgi:LEA14-like dessication related protein